MKFLPSLVLLLLSQLIASGSPAPTASKAEQVQVASKVFDIFSAKCLDCHAADLPRPKGKFGYVLDLQRVANQKKFIVKGQPEDSDLYTMVRDDEMPGEDAQVPGLTKAEKETVRRWIEIGAPSELPPSKMIKVVSSPPAETEKLVLPLWKHSLRWLGRFHAVSTHFPVALLMVALMAEGLAWLSKRDSWMQTVRFLVIIAAMGAVSAAVLGWVNASFTSYVGTSASILLWHRWLGTITAVWAVICAGILILQDCAEGSKERVRFRAALFLGASLVGISGFLGSALIYGLDHYSW